MNEWQDTEDKSCPKCRSNNIKHRVFESFDGAHEDDHYICKDCNYDWWIDGPDY